MNVKMKLKMKMMVKVGDNVGYHVFKVIFVDLCVFKVILWNWYRVIFCKKKYIGASLYVEIKSIELNISKKTLNFEYLSRYMVENRYKFKTSV